MLQDVPTITQKYCGVAPPEPIYPQRQLQYQMGFKHHIGPPDNNGCKKVTITTPEYHYMGWPNWASGACPTRCDLAKDASGRKKTMKNRVRVLTYLHGYDWPTFPKRKNPSNCMAFQNFNATASEANKLKQQTKTKTDLKL